MTEVANQERATSVPLGADTSPLVLWAYEARQAAQIATSLAKTSFVPKTMQGKPEDVTAAILAGQELGLPPMASLRSMDIIQGVPALRAHAMRGLIQSKGHQIRLVESTATRCIMWGRRDGDEEWQKVSWTIDRAKQLGLTSKGEWTKQPQTMLVARATGEVCRLIAADVLHAVPYTVEELSGDLPEAIVGRARRNGQPRTAQRKAIAPPMLEDVEPDLDEPEKAEPTGDTPPEPDLNEEWPAVAEAPKGGA